MPPSLCHESQYSGVIAGIDEAGRGPWAGPVVAAAAILNPKQLPDGLDDSKKLTAAKRDKLYDFIINNAHTAIGIASVEEIDSLNILAATMLAMQRALEALPLRADVALVDGNRAPKLACNTVTIVGGDALSVSIAAASIVAKVTRDRMMCVLAREHPGYGWEKNAGYGTRAHQDGLARHGITPHHRQSFAPIKALLSNAA
jgi:ribonuclease HII